MSKSLDIAALNKKLRCVVNTQDSIPMFSLWIIHHKAHHKTITNQWLEVLKKSKPSHCLTLLYLCNDVIQNCKRKKAEIYKESYSDVLPEAIPLLRDKAILPSVQRVFKVWGKRNCFDVDFIDQLHAALLTNRAPDKLKTKLLIEYKPSKLIEDINSFKHLEDDITITQKKLSGTRVDASNLEAIHNLKDKIGGEKFSQEFEESAVQLEAFISQYEKFIEERTKLLEMLDKGSVFYHAQYHEAKVVVDAYKSFGERVTKMKKGLNKVKKRLPGRTTIEQPPPRADDDMEMSDDDMEGKPSNIIAVNPSLTRKKDSTPTKKDAVIKGLTSESDTPITPKKKTISRPGMRGATFGGSLPGGQGYKTMNESVKNEESIEPDRIPSPPTGSESPPSPTGSPELNISSPPRLSLESRLADLFAETNQETSVASDSESEVETKATKTEQKTEDESDVNKDNDNTKTIEEKQPVDEEKTEEKQTIPVIGGSNPPTSTMETIQKVLLSLQEGDSTPTQDEKKSPMMSPPPEEAINFLTNFLGQVANADDATTVSETTTTTNGKDASSPVTTITTAPTTSTDNWAQQMAEWSKARAEASKSDNDSVESIPPPFEEPPPWLNNFKESTESASDSDPITTFNKAWQQDATSNLITVSSQSKSPYSSSRALDDAKEPSSSSLDTDIRMHDKDIYNDNLPFPSENDFDQRSTPKAAGDYYHREYEADVIQAFHEKEKRWPEPPRPTRYNERFHGRNVNDVDLELEKIHKEIQIQKQSERSRYNHMAPQPRYNSPNRMLPTRGRGIRAPISPYSRPMPPRHPHHHHRMPRHTPPHFRPRSYYG